MRLITRPLRKSPALPGLQARFEPASVALSGEGASALTLTLPAGAKPAPLAVEVKGTDAAGKVNTLCLQLGPPKGGELSIVSALTPPTKTRKNIEFILDASGSMKIAMGKKTRWDVALETLHFEGEAVVGLQRHRGVVLPDVGPHGPPAELPGDRDAVVAVAHKEYVADAVQLHGWHLSAGGHQPLDVLPALLQPVGAGQKGPGKVAVAAHTARDLLQGDLLEVRIVRVLQPQLVADLLKAQQVGGAPPQRVQGVLDKRPSPRLSPPQAARAGRGLGHGPAWPPGAPACRL